MFLVRQNESSGTVSNSVYQLLSTKLHDLFHRMLLGIPVVIVLRGFQHFENAQLKLSRFPEPVMFHHKTYRRKWKIEHES